MKALMFPGQGSQKPDMGQELFENFPELVNRINENLGYSIQDLCSGNYQNLNNTLYTQIAIYVVNALNFYKYMRDGNALPDFVLGHSLGEYNALLAAEAFDFFTGLELIKKRSSLMASASNGGMIAIIGLESKEINDLIQENNITKVVIANYNTRLQNVLSGDEKSIKEAIKIFKETKAKAVIPLQVSGAFHSYLMMNAENKFSDFTANLTFNIPVIPVISNYTGLPYKSDLRDLKDKIVKQISNPVRWYDSINYLLNKQCEFYEIGESNILSNMIDKIKNNQ